MMIIAAKAGYPTGEEKIVHYVLIILSVLLFPVSAARAEVNVGVGISVPGVSIGINMPAYPRLVQVPGYPVYYDPRADLNFFFYDGMYWVFQGNNWSCEKAPGTTGMAIGGTCLCAFVCAAHSVRYYPQATAVLSWLESTGAGTGK